MTMTTHDPEYVDLISQQLEAAEVKFILAPAMWERCILPTSLSLNWERIQFTESAAVYLPNATAGVYCFVLHPTIHEAPKGSYLLYIGKTRELRRRYREYLRDRSSVRARDHIRRMLNKWDENHLWFYYARIADPSLLDSVENALLVGCLPPFNMEFPAQVNKPVQLFRQLGAFRPSLKGAIHE